MLLSIITINRNNSAGLEKTLASVAAQTNRNFEHIIIDGNSTDDSVKVIQEFTDLQPGVYQSNSDKNILKNRKSNTGNTKSVIKQSSPENHPSNHSPVTYWISEPDNGIYHAMNKGIRLAKGEYLHFLNSGDWLVDEMVVENMLNKISVPSSPEKEQAKKPDILVGNVISVRPDGKVQYKKNQKEVSLLTFYRGTIRHTSAYIKRELFDKYGLYDETLKIVSDWKWYLIVAGLNKINVQFSDIYVTYFDTTGISSVNQGLDKEERRKVLEELLPAPILTDYDKYHFDISQMERIKKHPLLYSIFWFTERCLFKIEKWKVKYFGWKNKI